MTQGHDVTVLAVGAGPAGSTLAAELGWRGGECLLVEQTDGLNAHPRANMAGQRAMEIFRRWGIDQEVLAASLPPDYPIDVIFSSTLNGPEITRFSLGNTGMFTHPTPEVRQRIPDVNWSPYFKTQIGQNFLEPRIRAFAESTGRVKIRYGTKLVDFRQDADGVDAVLETDGQRDTVRAKYLVACDGGGSLVRRQLGIGFEGRGVLARNRSIYFRAPGFLQSHPRGPGTLLWTLDPSLRGVFITIDGNELWTYNTYFVEAGDFDPAREVCRAIGREIPIEVLSVQPWAGYQVVAGRYREGRVFLCGDAAHLFNPTGGFGMNTAIVDAADLAWKLAAVEQGWGGRTLLDSYEVERRPVGVRNTVEAAQNFDRVATLMQLPAWIGEGSPRGQEAREAAAREIATQKKTWSASGMHLGYRYEGSPLIVADGTPPTPDSAQVYHPTARPGSRAPHVWLAPGRSTLDLTPRSGFALFDFGADKTAYAAFAAAARELRVPIAHQQIDSAEAAALYERTLVLVRPDGHVAWRGDAAPADVLQVLATVTGRSRTSAFPG